MFKLGLALSLHKVIENRYIIIKYFRPYFFFTYHCEWTILLRKTIYFKYTKIVKQAKNFNFVTQ